MFNLGWPELVLVGVAALIIFGPKRLPEAARSLGKSIRSFKDGLKEVLDKDDPESDQKNISSGKK